MRIDRQENDCDEFSGQIEIKGRGNNSWAKDKKPYAIKLAEKQPVMGMNKHKRWALLANASDKTLLAQPRRVRDREACDGHWTGAPDSRYVDVILNGGSWATTCSPSRSR